MALAVPGSTAATRATWFRGRMLGGGQGGVEHRSDSLRLGQSALDPHCQVAFWPSRSSSTLHSVRVCC